MAGTQLGRVGKPALADADDETNNRLFFRLFRVGTIYERQALREMNISAVQGTLLGALSRDPVDGVPLSELVEYLAVSRQNLDGVIRRLEKLGYVERREDADNRRVRIVYLTKAGRRAWDEIFARSLEFYRQATRGVPLAEKARFVETLTRISRGLQAVRLEPAGRGDPAPRAVRRRAAGKAAGRRGPDRGRLG